jgi:serine/threonine-protein kinase
MKSANVVVVDNSMGLIKIMDFGLAINLIEWDRKGKRAGSLLYMAPEQCIGEPTYASDVWGVGVIMYRMLTGKTPFMGHNEDELIDRITNSEPQNILELNPKSDPKLIDLIMKCLEKDAAKRYHYEDMPEPYRVG